ncbi:MAG: DNA-3-methyladenine glycosylase I [Bacteroidetes bacterium]|nr:DNA-3-methyladenine glycosylase I [Bacteroidota bacterium]
MEQNRCPWTTKNKLMIKYHDEEWGVPVHNERKHFEFLLLESFQAGLSWQTIINKRKNFKEAFDNFDYKKIAVYKGPKIRLLLNDAGIIRNKVKINAVISNAHFFIEIRKEFSSFDKYIWSFVNFKPVMNNFKSDSQIPVSSKLSDKISADLKERGFKFVGTTIIYAHIQSIGMVNDHLVSCFRYKQVGKLTK